MTSCSLSISAISKMIKNKQLDDEYKLPFAFLLFIVSLTMLLFLLKQTLLWSLFLCSVCFLPYVNYFFDTALLNKVMKFSFMLWAVFLFSSLFLPPPPHLTVVIILMFPFSWMLITRYMKKQENRPNVEYTGTNLEQKVKHDFGLDNVSTHKMSMFSFLGGFMTVAYPFFTVTNRQWHKDRPELQREAAIHELMHVHLLLHKGYLYYGMLMLTLLTFLTYSALNWVHPVLFWFFNSVTTAWMLTLFELLTFHHTHEYGKTLGIETRQFDRKLVGKYMTIYMVQLFILTIFFSLVELLIAKVSSL